MYTVYHLNGDIFLSNLFAFFFFFSCLTALARISGAVLSGGGESGCPDLMPCSGNSTLVPGAGDSHLLLCPGEPGLLLRV